MVEMDLENERLESLRLRKFGEDWIRSITAGKLDQLEKFCHPDVISNLLTPNRMFTLDNAIDLVNKFRKWFGDATYFHVEDNRVNLAGQQMGIHYRFRLQELGSWYVVEQQLYCTMVDGRIAQLNLLCSGFYLVDAYDRSLLINDLETEEQDPVPNGLLEFYTQAEDDGSTCAVLTPSIRAKLRQMQPEQILEIRVNDPSARGDIEAWCRLSGNTLLKVVDNEGAILRFFVKKK